jgi:hypothetical protein
LFLLFPVAYMAGSCLFNLMYGITNGSWLSVFKLTTENQQKNIDILIVKL